MSNYLLISDAAKEVKVESHVLRYWEEELHLPIKRNELGHRYYTQDDVERFKQIKGMKERGLQLKAIKMILRDGKLDVLQQEDNVRETYEGALKGLAVEQRSMAAEVNASSTEQRRSTTVVKGSSAEAKNAGSLYEERTIPQMAIDIVASRQQQQPLTEESKEDKSRRLQWLLQQLIRETLVENNEQLCRDIKESVIKELDYQFRNQEEREEERERRQEQRNEEYYKKMDELLRKKSKRALLRAEKPDKKELKKEIEKQNVLDTSNNTIKEKRKDDSKGKITDIQTAEKKAKKKRHFIF